MQLSRLGAAHTRRAAMFASIRRHWTRGALIALLALGAGIRAHGLSDALVSFHNTRQLHCAIITRALYYDWTRAPSDRQRQIADRASERRGRLEPPIVQNIVATGYWLSGGEHMGIARVFNALLWLAAAFLLFRLARVLTSSAAALVAVAYFVLLPYGVVASQSFQPDPLMVLLMVGSWLAIVHNDIKPSSSRAALAGLLSGAAIVVKPVCGPVIAALYLVLALRRRGPLRWLRSGEPWLVAVLLLAPTLLYYVPELAGGGRLRSQADGSFMPELWHKPEFWRGWWEQIEHACGGTYVIAAAVLGLLFAPAGRTRAALWALGVGYGAYGLAFTYHISTHDYYQLQLLPIIGLALASLACRSWRLPAPRLRPALALICALLLVWVAYVDAQALQTDAWPRTSTKAGRDERYVAIGALVQHSTKVIFLDTNKYGGPLEFDGEVSGWLWPSGNDLRRKRRQGRPPFDWRARLTELMGQGAEYFVSSPGDELPRQRELYWYIFERYPRISNHPRFVVFDLRHERTRESSSANDAAVSGESGQASKP